MQAQQTRKNDHYTFDEYIKMEKESPIRYEYYHGEVFSMAGATLNHGDIADNINECFKHASKSKDCRSFQENAKLEVEKNGIYVYPDVVLTCHPDDVRSEYLIKNPVLIVEVTSPSSENYDRGKKWRYYRRISSLRYYLLVSQYQPYVELYSRKSATSLFQLQDFSSMEDIIHFPEPEFSISLQQVYDGIQFPPASETEIENI